MLDGNIDITTQVTGYATGTWTPSMLVGGVERLDAANAIKMYTKIGRVVYINAHIGTNATVAAGTYDITGLPFSIVSRGAMSATIQQANNSYNDATTIPTIRFYESTSLLKINLNGLALGSDDRINIGGFYFTS